MKVHGIDYGIVKSSGEVIALLPWRCEDENGKVFYERIGDRTEYPEDAIDRLDDYEGSLWEFLGEYHPGYNCSAGVALSDDIECALTGEADDEKLQRVVENCGVSPVDWLRVQMWIDTELFEEAALFYWREKYESE